MTDTSHTNTPATNKPSKLAMFDLKFEYDRTWTEAKQTVQHRPIKK